MSERPTLPMAVAVALVTGALALAGFGLIAWSSVDAACAGIDFNAALFEDFLGPYWSTAERLTAGSSEPAPGYLYPAFGAYLLAPLTLLGPGGASWVCAAVMLASVALLLASAFTFRAPHSLAEAAGLGAATFLAHAVVHGAYWGQASLPVIALSAAAFAAWSRGRSKLGGVLIGIAAAIKLTPLVFLLVPLAARDRRAFQAGASTFVACALIVPLVLLGPAGFTEFHGEIAQRLGDMATWVATQEGGRGSQDLGALFARGFGESTWIIGRVIGVALALGLVYLAARAVRGGAGSGRAFVLLSAVPWLIVGPSWPHALAWIVVAWWLAAQAPVSKVTRALTGASVIVGSVLMLRITGDPGVYARLGLPAAAAALAVLGTLSTASDGCGGVGRGAGVGNGTRFNSPI